MVKIATEFQKSKILFISLGRPTEHNMLKSFIWRMAETYPEAQIYGLMDAQWSNKLQLPVNMKPIFLEKDQFFLSGNQQKIVSVTAINEFLNDLETLDFDHVYYLDSLIWGEWITTVFEKDIIKTISLSGFEGLPQKYRYLLDTFQCKGVDYSEDTVVTSDAEVFFAESLTGSRVLYVGHREFAEKLFAKSQACLSSLESEGKADLLSKDVQGLIELWEKGSHRGNLTPAFFGNLDLFEVVGDEYTNSLVASQSRMLEYSHCQTVLRSYTTGSETSCDDPHLAYASLRRLQGLANKIIENLESEDRLMQGLETRHLDLQLGSLTLETLGEIHGNFNEVKKLKEPLIQFTKYLSAQIEVFDADQSPKSVKGKP